MYLWFFKLTHLRIWLLDYVTMNFSQVPALDNEGNKYVKLENVISTSEGKIG
jgi:hypothetical protein